LADYAWRKNCRDCHAKAPTEEEKEEKKPEVAKEKGQSTLEASFSRSLLKEARRLKPEGSADVPMETSSEEDHKEEKAKITKEIERLSATLAAIEGVEDPDIKQEAAKKHAQREELRNRLAQIRPLDLQIKIAKEKVAKAETKRKARAKELDALDVLMAAAKSEMDEANKEAEKAEAELETLTLRQGGGEEQRAEGGEARTTRDVAEELASKLLAILVPSFYAWMESVERGKVPHVDISTPPASPQRPQQQPQQQQAQQTPAGDSTASTKDGDFGTPHRRHHQEKKQPGEAGAPPPPAPQSPRVSAAGSERSRTPPNSPSKASKRRARRDASKKTGVEPEEACSVAGSDETL
jgi:hypothetical protein